MHDLLTVYVSSVCCRGQIVYFSNTLSFLYVQSCPSRRIYMLLISAQVKHASLVTLFSNLGT